MLKRIYPADQVERYLLIDCIAVLTLIGRVMLSASPALLLEHLILLAMFLFSFYVCLWYRDWRLFVGSFTGCMSLAILAAGTDSWILLYGFLFAHLLGRANRKWLIGAGMAGIVCMFLLHGWMKEGRLAAVAFSMHYPLLIAQLATPILVYMRQKARALEEKLDIANEKLERYIQEEERNRIARDLHDTLGQTLTMIKLKSELALRLAEKHPEKVKDELTDILNSSRYALKQAGELVSEMKYVSLEQEMEQSKDVLKKAGFTVECSTEKGISPLSNAAETMLALSIREAVTNMIKHSGANRCVLARYERDGHYYVQVSDNGNGNLKLGEGNGLQSMKERMAALRGEVVMESQPKEGTSITFQVPLKHNRRVEQA